MGLILIKTGINTCFSRDIFSQQLFLIQYHIFLTNRSIWRRIYYEEQFCFRKLSPLLYFFVLKVINNPPSIIWRQIWLKLIKWAVTHSTFIYLYVFGLLVIQLEDDKSPFSFHTKKVELITTYVGHIQLSHCFEKDFPLPFQRQFLCIDRSMNQRLHRKNEFFLLLLVCFDTNDKLEFLLLGQLLEILLFIL